MAAISEDFTPMSDLRASMSYRYAAAANMLMRYFLTDQGIETDIAEVHP